MQVSRYEIRVRCRPPPELKGERATTRGFCFGSVVFHKRAWTRWRRGTCVPGRASLPAGCPWFRQVSGPKGSGVWYRLSNAFTSEAGGPRCAAVQKLTSNPQQQRLAPGRSEGKGIPHPTFTLVEAGGSQCLFVFPSEPLSHHPWERRA